MTIVPFLMFVITAVICAIIAMRFVPGQIPGGFFTTVMIGILGSYIGAHLLGNFGPSIENVSLLPTILGSAVLIAALAVLSNLLRSKKT